MILVSNMSATVKILEKDLKDIEKSYKQSILARDEEATTTFVRVMARIKLAIWRLKSDSKQKL